MSAAVSSSVPSRSIATPDALNLRGIGSGRGERSAQLPEHPAIAAVRIGRTEHRRARDEGIGAGAPDFGDVVDLHAALDLEPDRLAPRRHVRADALADRPALPPP